MAAWDGPGVPDMLVYGQISKLNSQASSLSDGKEIMETLDNALSIAEEICNIWNTTGGKKEAARLNNILTSMHSNNVSTSISMIKSGAQSVRADKENLTQSPY